MSAPRKLYTDWSLSPTTQTLRCSAARAETSAILRVVGVLVLVDEDVAEAMAVVLEHLGLALQQLDGDAQQVVEVHGAGGLKAALVLAVHIGDAALEDRRGPVGVGVDAEQLVLGRADGGVHAAGREALGVDVEIAQHHLGEAHGVGLVVDRERRPVPEPMAVAAQHAHARAVEGRDPHLLRHRTDQPADPLTSSRRRPCS